MITKLTLTLEDGTTKDVYTEFITTTQEREITIDMIDSQITQNNNNIASLQSENEILEAKKQEMLAL
jgi:phage-related protein